jgi:hypothetical protein
MKKIEGQKSRDTVPLNFYDNCYALPTKFKFSIYKFWKQTVQFVKNVLEYVAKIW